MGNAAAQGSAAGPGSRRRWSHAREAGRLLGAGVGVCLTVCGCSHYTAQRNRTQSRLAEESRVLTTAIVDTLEAQPAPPREVQQALALALAKQDQRLEGLPAQPLEVGPLLAAKAAEMATDPTTVPSATAEQRQAATALKQRFAEQDRWIAQARRAGDKLTALGEEKEAERNARWSFWLRFLGLGGLGVGGLVALILLVPAAIPLLGRLLGWIVGRLPSLAGAVGVVSTRAFDAVVRGVERFKQSNTGADPATTPPTTELLGHLSSELDADHKALVRSRRAPRAGGEA